MKGGGSGIGSGLIRSNKMGWKCQPEIGTRGEGERSPMRSSIKPPREILAGRTFPASTDESRTLINSLARWSDSRCPARLAFSQTFLLLSLLSLCCPVRPSQGFAHFWMLHSQQRPRRWRASCGRGAAGEGGSNAPSAAR